MHTTIIGVDLAKDVIQVCVVKHNKVLSNEEMIPSEFISWLANHPRSMVVFEACAMSNYWKQKAVELVYTLLSCNEESTFKTAREASACVGVTPILLLGWESKIRLNRKHVKNTLVRSHLISGAMSVVNQICRRDPKTTKEKWLKELIERRGKKCAAVALANKTVRTAFAMLPDGTEYPAQVLEA